MLKGLKDIFLGEVPIVPPSPSPAAPPEAPKARLTPVPARESRPLISAGLQEPDPELEAQFMAAIRSSKAPALTSLLDNVEALADSIPDAAGLYKAAMKLTRMRFPDEQLLADFETIEKVLSEKESEFGKELAAQTSKKVDARIRTATATQSMIEQKREQIRQLQAEIPDLEAQVAEDQRSAEQERAKIDAIRSRFDITMQAFRSKLASQRTKAQTLGKV